jgi:predicted RNA binding protein YcfA (HicA-like mRNA interferase family)
MPKKIRELKATLERAGFTYRSGKGSHTVWSHPLLPYSLTISGKDGSDADRYQEKDVKNALQNLDKLQESKGDNP